MKYLSLKKLAEDKKIPVSSIRSFIKAGLPHYRPGSRKILVCPEEFDQWFTDNFRVEREPTSDNINQLIEETLAGIG